MKKMFLLGDSISGHYGPFLAEFLSGTYEIFSKPREDADANQKYYGGNGGDSSMVLEYIREREAQKNLKFDLFVFNCGLHDIKRKVPEEFYQVPIDQYEQNLEAIYQILTGKGIPCIFVNTTPVDEVKHCTEIPAGIKRYNADVQAYNEVAARIAAKYQVPVLDLYSFSDHISGDKYCDYAHFNIETRKIQAAFLAGGILSCVAK